MKIKTKINSVNKKPAKSAKKKMPSSKKSLLSRQKKIKNLNNANLRKKEKEPRDTKEGLRRRAEKMSLKISDRSPVKPEVMSAEKIRRTFHELQVHQIELEMQNEEMRRAQAELDLARARYFDLYDLAPVGYCTVNEEGLILEANLTAATMLGVARGKLLKQSLTRFVLKEDQDIYYMHRKKLFKSGEHQTCDIRMMKKDGSVFWAHLVGAAAMDEDGSMVCRIIMSDITERKQAEEILYIEQQRFRVLAEQSSDIILLLNRDGNIIYENPAIEKILGFKIKERIGRNAFENILPDDKHRVKEAFDTFIGNRNSPPRHNEISLRDINGNMHTFESVSRHLIEDNISEGIIVNLRDITDRKKAEEALRRSEEDFKSLFEQSLDGIIIISQSLIVMANHAFCVISGFPLEKAIGANPLDFIHPEDRKMAEQRIGEMLSGKQFSEGHVYRAFREDGSLSWIEMRSKLIQWKGKPAFQTILRDITELKKAAKEWQETFDTVGDAICLLDVDQRILRCNGAMAKMFGLKQEELIGRHCWEVVHNSTKPISQCPVTRTRNSLIRKETEIQIKNRWLNITADPLLDETGTLRGIVHIVRNITERKRMEDKLRREEHLFRALAEQSSDIIVFVNKEGLVTYENPVVEKILGFKPEERIGVNLFDRIHPDDLKFAIDAFHSPPRDKNDPALHYEIRLRHKNGSWRTLETVGSRLVNDNIVETVIINLRDITERKQAEESLREAELKFRTIFNSASEGILLAQAGKRNFVEANEKICDMLGYTKEELLKLKVPDIHPEASLSYVLDQFEKLSKGEKWIARDIPLLKKDNSILFADVTSSPIAFEGKECLIGMFRDAKERRKAEEELRESRESYRRLFEDHSAAKLIIDPNTGMILDANKAAVNYYGWTREQMQQMKISDINTLTPEEIKSELEKAKQHKKVQFEFRHRLAEGSVRDVEVYSSTIEMNGKEVLHSIVHDITERKQASEALRDSEEKFRILTESSPTAVLLYQNNKWVYANHVATEITGYTTQELQCMNFWEIVHPDDKQLVQERGQKRQKGEAITKRYIFRIICKDGTVKWIDLSGATIVIGGSPAGIISVLEITEQKLAEEALRENEIKYRTLFESASDTIFLLDKNVFIDCNEKALEMFRCTREQIIGQSPYRFSPEVQPDGRNSGEKALEKNNATLSGRPQYFEWKHLRYDGTTFDAEISLNAINDRGKSYIQAICRDISERKKAEEEIIKLNTSLEQRVLERTAELEAFSYSVSHDLRAPLRTIEGFGLALLEDYENKLDPQAKDYLDRIRSATGTMAELIEDMLKLFRITRTEMDLIPVNLPNIAKSITDELRKSQPDRIVNIIIDESMEDSADPRLIRIVLENLLGNAWKFTEKKINAEIEFGLIKKDVKNVYFVRDNGAGFDMEYAHKLFAPFQRLHNIDEYPGTGIGLAIIKRIISRHGGTVWAEGTPGQGATFYFTLQ